MLRRVVAYLVAAVMLASSISAFPQLLNEIRDTAPGSLLFAALQLLIGTSSLATAIGLVTRARWTARVAAVWGIAAVALLALQPLYSTMDADAQRAIWIGAAAVGLLAAGVSWFARAANARAPRGTTQGAE